MMLMEEAERIARDEHGSNRLAVISGEPTSMIHQTPADTGDTSPA